MIQHEGPGWRLARDPLRRNFTVIIGGAGWVVELSEQEWTSLMPLVTELVAQHEKLVNQLMPDESICLEMGKEYWWACLDGDRKAWSLQLIFEGDRKDLRGFEAYWPIPAAQSVTNAMRLMWDCG